MSSFDIGNKARKISITAHRENCPHGMRKTHQPKMNKVDQVSPFSLIRLTDKLFSVPTVYGAAMNFHGLCGESLKKTTHTQARTHARSHNEVLLNFLQEGNKR